jgi:hypothetical protein
MTNQEKGSPADKEEISFDIVDQIQIDNDKLTESVCQKETVASDRCLRLLR